MYGHVQKLAEAEKRGIEAAGGKADLYQYVKRQSRLLTWFRLSHFNLSLCLSLELTLTFCRVKETLPEEVLKKMYAPGQTDAIPFINPDIMETYDAFLFGIPTRYGNFPAQWKALLDHTGKQWQTGACKQTS